MVAPLTVLVAAGIAYGKCSKISNTEKENTLNLFSLLTTQAKGLTNFAKGGNYTNFTNGGNLIASLCKIGYFPHRILMYSFSKLRFYCTNF